MPDYLIEKEPNSLIPFTGTSDRATVYARSFRVWARNADGSRTLFGGPTFDAHLDARPAGVALTSKLDDTPEVVSIPYVRTDPVTGALSLVSGDGTPIEGGGGGGSTTFADLTDKATADIPAINTPLATALALKAPLASPALTGTPTAPTAAGGTNTTQIATTAFVLANGGTALGPYADAAALETAKPAASNGGRIGLVGASAPYTPYVSNGTAWILFDNLVDPLVTIAASGTSVSQAAANLSVMDITLTGNATIAFTGIPAGAWCVTLLLKQDGTGSRLVTWPANTKWQGGTPPVLSTAAGAEDDVTLMTTDGGTTWRGFFNGKGMV